MLSVYRLLVFSLVGALEAHFSKCQCKPCTCKDYGTVLWVDCSFRNLTQIPENLPKNTTHLDLSNNRLSGAIGNINGDFPDLVELNLNNNDIFMLWGDDFHTPRLKRLHLHGNHLQYLNQPMFRNMVKLEELTLHNNHGLELEVGVFDQLTSLQTLHLSNCGLTLDAIHHRTLFLNLVKLRTLHLDQNSLVEWRFEGDELVRCKYLEIFTARDSKINYLPEKGLFRKNPRLRRVDLSGNDLLFVKTTEFGYSWKLESLNISHNKIIYFEPQHKSLAFRAPQRLRELDLSNNELQTLPLDLLTQISSRRTSVGIYNNHNLECSPIFLFRIIAYLSSTRNEILSAHLIKCRRPIYLAGQVIGNFSCPEGGKFNICSSPVEPQCGEPKKYSHVNSGCVPRCECPEDRPIAIDGVCSRAWVCKFLDIGGCHKERALNRFSDQKKVYIPSCNSTGSYKPLQCRKDGKCWCTDPKGEKRCPMFHRKDVKENVCDESEEHIKGLELLPQQYPPDSNCEVLNYKTCAIWGNGRVKQYDGTTFQVSADCYYALISDYSTSSRYHLYVRFTPCEEKPFCITMLQLYVDKVHLIRMSLEFNVYYDNKVVSLPVNSETTLFGDKVRIVRKDRTLSLHMEHLEILYSNQNYLVVRANVAALSNIQGACGSTYQQDVHDGYRLFSQQKLIQNCVDSRELKDNEYPTRETWSCRVVKETAYPRFITRPIVRGCEADSQLIDRKDAMCGSLAAVNSYQADLQPSQTLDQRCV